MCNGILILTRSFQKKKKIARLLFLLNKRKVSCAQIFWVKNDCNVQQHLFMRTIFSLMNNNKMKSKSCLTDENLKSTMTVVSSNLIMDRNPLPVEMMLSLQPIYAVAEVRFDHFIVC
jgi:hypothetical protein